MFKKIIIAAACLISVCANAGAFKTPISLNHWYIGAFLSSNYASKIMIDGTSLNRYKNLGIGWGGRLGYQLNNFFRLEIASGYNRLFLDGKARFSSGRTGVTSKMLNAYVNFNNRSRFTPYIGAGMGYARYRISNLVDTINPDDPHESFNSFYALSLQSIIGLMYAVNQHFTIDFNTAYFEQQKTRKIRQDGGGNAKAKITMPTVNLGVVYFC